jgi:glutathione synthase/RimK-type ligase-like ATP-grasp enzyme
MAKRNIASKWLKHEALRRSSWRLSKYMPETRRLTRDNLERMLDKYGMVYVKPVFGALGTGVMRVDKTDGGLSYQIGLKRKRYSSISAGYAALLKETRGKAYMVQRGIWLARYKGQPFDIRVMVQRLPRKPWKMTGMAARVAAPGKIVTNGSQGGTIYPVSMLISNAMKRRLRRISLRAARRLHAVFPGLVQIGLDVAVDQSRRPWIIEANTYPDPCPFTKLPSLRALRRILRYQRAWGIRRRLKCLKARQGVPASAGKRSRRRHKRRG